MAKALADDQLVTTADGVPLRTKLRRAERLARLRAYGLVLPLFAFIFITFFMPIVVMLARSVDNPLLADNFPNTLTLLQDWDPAKDRCRPSRCSRRLPPRWRPRRRPEPSARSRPG